MQHKNKSLTLGSLFSGSGGFELGGILAGITPIWASEIEAFPIRVTTKRMPFVKHYGDISKIKGAEIEPVDIITFGSPCFPAGTLVLTDKGYMPIEKIHIGMKVLTHKGRWRVVTATGFKEGKTVVLKGNHYGLECTPNHPIYSAEKKRKYKNKKTGYVNYIGEEKQWTPAEKMLGRLWAVPHVMDSLTIPRKHHDGTRKLNNLPTFNTDFFYLVGRWLGDGWLRDGQRSNRPKGQCNGTIIVCAGYDKEEKLKEAVEAVVDKYSVERGRTAVKYQFCSILLCEWLKENFGKYAYGKKIPSWAFSMPKNWRLSLLQGVLDTDGYRIKENSYRITTISKELAHGLRLLGETLGYSTTVYYAKMPSKCVIEGRICNQQDQYSVQLTYPNKRSRLSDELHSWYNVKNVKPTGETKTVYNLTVDEDNSYVAEGIVVHNCQDMSIAGKRNGLDGSRSSLFYEAIRIIKEMREKTNGEKPRYIVWENVPGAFSSNKGEDFKAVLEEICKVKSSEANIPRLEKWSNAGQIMADDFSVAWRVLDAQYWGVPQRRSRIYLVADFDGGSAGKVLFESESLSGDFKESKRTWEEITRCFREGSNKTSLLAEDRLLFENHGQDSRFKGPLDVSQTVSATFGTGGNNQPFVVAGTYDIRLTSEGTKNARHNVYETDTSRTIDTGGNLPDSNQGGIAVVEAYGISSKDSNAMKSANPNSGIYKATTSRTLDANGGNPACNQGGIAVIEGNGTRPSHRGDGYSESDKMYTLNATEQHKVAYEEKVYAIDRESYNCGRNFNRNLGIKDDGVNPTLKAAGPNAVGQKVFSSSKASFFTSAGEEIANTLVATDYKDPPLVNDKAYGFYPLMKAEGTCLSEEKSGCILNGTNPGYQNGVVESEYIVRRLTPTECARLQGFPDWWCEALETEEPTEEELTFWREVFETHRLLVTGAKKPKTDKQIIKWLKNPHTDSAEYKMWGNGVALPNVVYVLKGISHYGT